MRENLESNLLAYANSDAYAFHMPGHKRLLNPIRVCAENKDGAYSDGKGRKAAPEDSEKTAFPADNQQQGKSREPALETPEKPGFSAERQQREKLWKTDRDEPESSGGVISSGLAEDTLLQLDITEIDGFDNLHDPQGILRDEMRLAAEMYGAKETLFSVNGSTCALLAAISAAVPKGGTILIERRSHMAVYHAAYLRDIDVMYVEDAGRDDPGTIPYAANAPLPSGNRGVQERTGGNFRFTETVPCGSDAEDSGAGKNIDAVVITSPTYEGCVKDVAGWAEYAHANGAVLIVDEAHGAHFGFHPYFPESAVRCGADLVVQSTHKTLPAMTQTALLHNVTGRVPMKKLQFFMDIYETSSPSYVLMASITSSLRLVRERGEELFAAYAERLLKVRRELCSLKHFRLAGGEDAVLAFDNELPPYKAGTVMDPGKLVLVPRYRDEKVSGAGIKPEDSAESASALRCENAEQAAEFGKHMRTEAYDVTDFGNASGLNGAAWLYDELRDRYHLQMEMRTDSYCLAMTSIADSDEGFERLAAAMREIDERVEHDFQSRGCKASDARTIFKVPVVQTESEGGMKISAALDAPSEEVDLADAAGRICADFVILYPPDVPLAVPGEVYTEEKAAEILGWIERGFSVMGVE